MKTIPFLLILFVGYQSFSQDLLMNKANNTLKRASVIPFQIIESFDSIPRNQKSLSILISKDSTKGIEIYIKNTSKDSLEIQTQRGSLFIIQEAKNELGEWKPIEYWLYSDSGSAYSHITLKKEEIVKTITRSYEGELNTEIRVKLYTGDKVYYSNSIRSNIHPSQFMLPAIVMKYRMSYILKDLGGKELLYKYCHNISHYLSY